MSKLTSLENAILTSANEDYCSLGEAALEGGGPGHDGEGLPAAEAVKHLVERDYVYVSELEQTATKTCEVRRLDTAEALDVLRRPEAWTPPTQRKERFFALSPTQKGRDVFRRLIGVPRS